MRSLGRIPRRRVPVPPAAEPRGFALPSVMLTLLLVSLMAAGGFFVTWVDGQSARAFARSTEAFYVAESGLATALALAEMPNPSVPPVTLGVGTATVSFEHLLELRPGEAVYRVESLGRVVYGGANLRAVGGAAPLGGRTAANPRRARPRGERGRRAPEGDDHGARCVRERLSAAAVAGRGRRVLGRTGAGARFAAHDLGIPGGPPDGGGCVRHGGNGDPLDGTARVVGPAARRGRAARSVAGSGSRFVLYADFGIGDARGGLQRAWRPRGGGRPDARRRLRLEGGSSSWAAP